MSAPARSRWPRVDLIPFQPSLYVPAERALRRLALRGDRAAFDQRAMAEWGAGHRNQLWRYYTAPASTPGSVGWFRMFGTEPTPHVPWMAPERLTLRERRGVRHQLAADPDRAARWERCLREALARVARRRRPRVVTHRLGLS
jgi:hypothetical protein